MVPGTDPIALALLLGALTLLPLLLIVTTSFLKTSMVLLIVRNAIGVQQVPPGMAIYAIAMILTLYVMAPTFQKMADGVMKAKTTISLNQPLTEQISHIVEPLRVFMLKHAKEDQREIFLEKAKHLWSEEKAKEATSKDFIIVVPAFMVSEMQAGFEMGFMIYIPFLVIDLIISNILLALGMQMVSPNTISLPLKLFLFVVVDGWGKLLEALLNSYL